MSLTPINRPTQDKLKTLNILGSYGVFDKVALLGIRGFYDRNAYGTYDDAVFVVYPHGGQIGFNFNTDPVRHRAGHGYKDGVKGMATLKPGLYSYKLGMHKGLYECLVQANDVTVYRDADSAVEPKKIVIVDGYKMYEETGEFGIHIHHGGVNTTSSEGCQTVPIGGQWDEFIKTVKHEMELASQHHIPYLLIGT